MPGSFPLRTFEEHHHGQRPATQQPREEEAEAAAEAPGRPGQSLEEIAVER
jgi:hypothetical protein